MAATSTLKVINLFGAPSSGKSTTRAGTFYRMKLRGYAVEEVTEVAKDIVWDRSIDMLKAQDLVFAQQRWRVERLCNHDVEFCITDSPILLSLLYAPTNFPASFTAFALDMNERYENINIYLRRVKPYVAAGRTQTEEQSNALADDVLAMLGRYNVPYVALDGDEAAPQAIIDMIEACQHRPRTRFGVPLIYPA